MRHRSPLDIYLISLLARVLWPTVSELVKVIIQYLSIKDKLQGTIILFRNNVSSPLFNHGIVRVYQDQWGDICHDYSFRNNESQVVCHQLGYTGASSHTRSGLVK